jgi:Transmembrane secretion effector
VAGAAVLPRLRARLTPGSVLTAGSLGLAVVALILGYVHVTGVVAAALVLGGLAWILALSTLSSLYQLTLPGWVKARGMSFYLIVFQGGNAVGSAVLGVTAQHAGLSPTLLIAAAALALGPLAGLRYRFQSINPEDLRPAGDWPAPQLAAGGHALADPPGRARPVAAGRRRTSTPQPGTTDSRRPRSAIMEGRWRSSRARGRLDDWSGRRADRA